MYYFVWTLNDIVGSFGRQMHVGPAGRDRRVGRTSLSGFYDSLMIGQGNALDYR
jgi:hypothetical protein